MKRHLMGFVQPLTNNANRKMNLYVLLILILCQQNQCETKQNEDNSLLDVVFWEVKPFIFTNREGVLDGMIPRIMKEAQYYCLRYSNKTLVANYALKAKSRKDFYNLARENNTYGEKILQNVSFQKMFWAPVLAQRTKILDKKGVKTFQLIHSKEIAVIVQKHYISLPIKMFRGIVSCKQIFVIAFLLSALMSSIVWFLEHFDKGDFQKSFIKGVGTAMWWSIVSMTTVGYGDIVPRTVLGRCVSVIWLFVGVMIACVLTATMTDIVSGIDDLNLPSRIVTVLEDSYEEHAATDHGAQVLPVHSYDAALEKVRTGEAFAAMINADIVAWHQSEITDPTQQTPLAIVKLLPANLHVECYMADQITAEMKKVLKCMGNYQKEEVYIRSINAFKRHCHVTTLYIGSLSELYTHNVYIRILTWVVVVIFAVGSIYELWLTCLERKGACGIELTNNEKNDSYESIVRMKKQGYKTNRNTTL